MKVNNFLRFHTAHLQECLNLGHFKFILNEDKKLSKDDAMETIVDCEYLTAEILWGKEVRRIWKTGNKTEIIRLLCHEIAHTITSEETSPMVDKKFTRQETFFDERVTETVGRICYRLYWRWLRETKPTGWRTYRFTP